jgi:hypothetical protein
MYTESERTINEFHKPVTAKTIKYKRIAGYFSSAVFSVLKDSLALFIQQEDSKIELITSHVIMNSDYKVMTEEQRHENIESIISEEIINDIESLTEKIAKDHLTVLDWLLQTGKLEIKIAVLEDNPSQSIMHRKLGCVEDKDGNKISFSGSENWSKKALIFNSENLDVFRNWVGEEQGRVASHFEQFQEVWENKDQTLKTYAFPEAVKKKIIQFRAKTEEEAEKAVKNVANHHSNTRTKPETNKKELRDYQKDAIKAWENNEHKGIYEMATASGKTFTALKSLETLRSKVEKLLVVIAVPTIDLCNQWETELVEIGEHDPITAYGTSAWQTDLANQIHFMKTGLSKNSIVITTHKTFSSTNFINLIKDVADITLLICDEVHASGSPKQFAGLHEVNYEYRLALSATPTRHLDDEGSKNLLDYFDKVVYSYTLSQAIAAGFLVPYYYHLYPVKLTYTEIEDIRKCGKRIQIAKSKKPPDNATIEREIFKRASIIANAENKVMGLSECLHGIDRDPDRELENILIFCAPDGNNQYGDVLELLGELSKTILKDKKWHAFDSKSLDKE